MAMVGGEESAFFATLALALVFAIAEGGEKQFPFFRFAREIGMRVSVGGHDAIKG